MPSLQQLVPQLRGSHFYPTLFGLLLIYVVASYILAWRRLRCFPGPRLASFSSLWILLQIPKKRQAEIYHGVVQRYGPGLVRIGPNDLLTDSPDVVRHMSSARSQYTRSSWYAAMRVDPTGTDSMLSTMDTAEHDRYKAKVAGGYSGRESSDLEDGIDAQVAALVDLIERKYLCRDGNSESQSGSGNGVGSGAAFTPFDLATAAQYFTLDTITRVAYGAPFGFLATDSDMHDYMKIIEEKIMSIVLAAEVPMTQHILLNKWLLKAFGPKPTDKKGIGRIRGVANSVVAERFGPGAKERPDMLGSFVRHGLRQDQCEQEVMLQIVAGSDTTATAIRGTMLYVCSTPLVYYRLQREIDEAVASGSASSPITAAEAKSLQYLQAVIYEGLRLGLPFTGLLSKKVPPGGDTIDGKFIPGGVRIGVATKGMQRRADVFGADADLFRPERWLDCPKEQHAHMTNTVELLFGHGRWMCAGKAVAFLELNKVYFELLRRFDFQIVNPKKPWREDNFNITFQTDLWTKVTPRRLATKA